MKVVFCRTGIVRGVERSTFFWKVPRLMTAVDIKGAWNQLGMMLVLHATFKDMTWCDTGPWKGGHCPDSSRYPGSPANHPYSALPLLAAWLVDTIGCCWRGWLGRVRRNQPWLGEGPSSPAGRDTSVWWKTENRFRKTYDPWKRFIERLLGVVCTLTFHRAMRVSGVCWRIATFVELLTKYA
jgi:hypothetical protein